VDITELKVVDACQAQNFYGSEIIIEGKVVNSYCSNIDTIFLNFGRLYSNQCFTVALFKLDQDKFLESPEKYYINRIIRARRVIKEDNGNPEIILDNPSQTEIGIKLLE